MSRSQRDKGYRGEREAVEILTALGWKAVRVPLSGAAQGFAGDVLIEDGNGRSVRVEVKRRASLGKYLAENYAVLAREDRGEWFLCVRLEDVEGFVGMRAEKALDPTPEEV